MINSAVDLWKILQEKGGLNAKDAFYDKPILENLVISLGLDITKPIENELIKNAISIESFLYAFFKVVEPYSIMMNDLLFFFEQVGIKHSNSNLDIAFDFSKETNDLVFNLDHFKNWTESWKEVSGWFLVNHWNYESLWDLNKIFRKHIQNDVDLKNTQLESWNYTYGQLRQWPDKLPSLPKILNDDFGVVVNKVWEIVQEIYKESKQYGSDRNRLIKNAFNNPLQKQEERGQLWDSKLLGRLDSDLWIDSLIMGIFHVLNTMDHTINPDKRVLQYNIISQVETIYKKLDKTNEKKTTTQKELEEFLDLPIWKKRYELYSVWISTKIISAIGLKFLEIHFVNHTLVFSFAGTHLASSKSIDKPIYIWSELRSPLDSPISDHREASIQPDYTILKDLSKSIDSAVLVVECKQYKKQSAKNFKEALLDYANGRPDAKIILVNYGPIKKDLIEDKILIEVKERIVAIGDMRPNNLDSMKQFNDEVKEALKIYLEEFDSSSKSSLTSDKAVVTLTWGNSPKDLDLHLKIKLTDGNYSEVGYSSLGTLSDFPFSKLNEDIKNGLGPEIIEISKFIDAEYYFYVHNYSNEISFSKSNAIINYSISNFTGNLICPGNYESNYWFLFKFNSITGELDILNELRNNSEF